MNWAHYLLQVNIYLVIFYAFYKLLLAKETYFVLNRLYLLTAGLLSMTIPFIRPEWFAKQQATQQIKIGVDQLNMMMTQVAVSDDTAQRLSLGQLAAGVYIAGLCFFSALFILKLIRLKRSIKVNRTGVAFSFFNKMVVDQALPSLDTIHKHEEIHARQLHTADVLFFELLGILNWCNPVIYFYKSTIKNIHEYLADEAAANFQGDKEAYAMLLLSKAFGVDQTALTNSFFNKSLIKKRIFMLHKQRSKRTAVLKYGLFLPLFAITLLLSSATISQNEEIKAVAEEIISPVSIPEIVLGDPIPENKNEQLDGFYTHLAESIKYPAKALNKNIQGNSVVKFTLTKGEVKEISTSTALGSGCDAEVMQAILSYSNLKTITSGKYYIKVAFRLAGSSNAPIINSKINTPTGYKGLKEVKVTGFQKPKVTAATKDKKVYDFVTIDLQPGFPGGMDKFYEYLSKNIKYPEAALKNNIQGKVFLSFIVETTGELSSIKVERGLGFGMDEEALRVMENSPKWTPGYSGNTPVRVKYNIPMSFTLANDKAKDKVILKTSSIIRDKSKDPIYVVDGITVESDTFKSMNSDEIESINVLKGAMAELYAKGGENGVILITTKKASQSKDKAQNKFYEKIK